MRTSKQSAQAGVVTAEQAPDLFSTAAAKPRVTRSQGHQSVSLQTAKPSIKWQIFLFITLMVSIISSRFIDYYRAAVSWSLLHDWQYLVFAAIVSLLTFPVVYRKAQRSRNDPILLQLGVIFTAGMGWEKVLSTAADFVKPVGISH